MGLYYYRRDNKLLKYETIDVITPRIIDDDKKGRDDSNGGSASIKQYGSVKNGGTINGNGVSKNDPTPEKKDVPKRTEEEEKLRKRLHAKREEERLREILKRKKDSFRKSIASDGINPSTTPEMKNDAKESSVQSSSGNDKKESMKMDVGDTKDKEASSSKDKDPSLNKDNIKSDGTSTGNGDQCLVKKDSTYRHDAHERRPEKYRHHRNHHRDRDRDRRPLPPPPPRYGDPPPYRGGFRRDERPPPNVGPSSRSPYNHSYYDSRRPPPPHHQGYHPPHPYRSRGDGDSRSPPYEVDPFGRQRRFSGPDKSTIPHRSDQDYLRRRRSRSPPNRNKRSRSRSRSASRSRSSHSASSYDSSSYDDDDDSSKRSRGRSRRRTDRRSSVSSRSSLRSDASSVSTRSRDRSTSSSSSMSRASSKDNQDEAIEEDPIPYTKDQRTIFVTQLVMRTTVKDLSKFFKHHGIKVNEIELLRDRRSGQHKGSAYVELKRMIDVNKALALSGQAPSFQRFPILIKDSEAERNLSTPSIAQSTLAAAPIPINQASVGVVPALVASVQQQIQKQAMKVKLPPLKDANGQLIQAQKVYVGNLEVNVVTSQHLQLLFAPFGTLTEVQLQNGKGFAFLQYYDPKEAALAIQTMSGQVLAGRPMKTGWATNPVVSINGVAVVTSNEFPPDAAIRVQNAYQILAQLTLASVAQQPYAYAGVIANTPSLGVTPVQSAVPTVAEARASLAATVAAKTHLNVLQHSSAVGVAAPAVTTAVTTAIDPTIIGNVDNPTRHLLVHNMFNKDEETDQGWENELRDEFIEECGKYGTIINVTVVSREVGGKIYATFSDITGAQTCARSLAGRWFDRRQLRVEYVMDEQVKQIEQEYPPASTK